MAGTGFESESNSKASMSSHYAVLPLGESWIKSKTIGWVSKLSLIWWQEYGWGRKKPVGGEDSWKNAELNVSMRCPVLCVWGWSEGDWNTEITGGKHVWVICLKIFIYRPIRQISAHLKDYNDTVPSLTQCNARTQKQSKKNCIKKHTSIFK